MDSLKNKYLYFSKPSELDDPFECRVVPNFSSTTVKEINNWLATMNSCKANMPYHNAQDVRNAIKSGELEKYYFENMDNVEKQHILSLCDSRENQLLWALYADYYRGVCIGYKTHRIEKYGDDIIPTEEQDSENSEVYALDIKKPNIKTNLATK